MYSILLQLWGTVQYVQIQKNIASLQSSYTKQSCDKLFVGMYKTPVLVGTVDTIHSEYGRYRTMEPPVVHYKIVYIENNGASS